MYFHNGTGIPVNPRLSNAETIVFRGHIMKVSIISIPQLINGGISSSSSNNGGTIFHTSALARIIQEIYGYLPRYYVLENEDGQFRAAIPLYLIQSRLTEGRLVCLPFSDYCYSLGNKGADIALLLNSAKKEVEAEVASYLEIRCWQNNVTPTQLDLVTRDYHLLYLLNLESDEKGYC